MCVDHAANPRVIFFYVSNNPIHRSHNQKLLQHSNIHVFLLFCYFSTYEITVGIIIIRKPRFSFLSFFYFFFLFYIIIRSLVVKTNLYVYKSIISLYRFLCVHFYFSGGPILQGYVNSR